ncbi:hypothetical protein SAMN06265361_10433 [Laceyella tengchongensis]|jgi:hypothetical protein|uniref:Uncharacterized protein n=1 Tax=Laceyella tengchongensis TaxID=574699 RepID=A0AA46AFU8_9BACL|nr:hypothetical protein SAMN06265361_10433 [Laceyella tengchongensis]
MYFYLINYLLLLLEGCILSRFRLCSIFFVLNASNLFWQ